MRPLVGRLGLRSAGRSQGRAGQDLLQGSKVPFKQVFFDWYGGPADAAHAVARRAHPLRHADAEDRGRLLRRHSQVESVEDRADAYTILSPAN